METTRIIKELEIEKNQIDKQLYELVKRRKTITITIDSIKKMNSTVKKKKDNRSKYSKEIINDLREMAKTSTKKQLLIIFNRKYKFNLNKWSLDNLLWRMHIKCLPDKRTYVKISKKIHSKKNCEKCKVEIGVAFAKGKLLCQKCFNEERKNPLQNLVFHEKVKPSVNNIKVVEDNNILEIPEKINLKEVFDESSLD